MSITRTLVVVAGLVCLTCVSGQSRADEFSSDANLKKLVVALEADDQAKATNFIALMAKADFEDAGLRDSQYTVFIPDDDAFTPAMITALGDDKSELKDKCRNHFVAGDKQTKAIIKAEFSGSDASTSFSLSAINIFRYYLNFKVKDDEIYVNNDSKLGYEFSVSDASFHVIMMNHDLPATSKSAGEGLTPLLITTLIASTAATLLAMA